jgi:hypothetical protein
LLSEFVPGEFDELGEFDVLEESSSVFSKSLNSGSLVSIGDSSIGSGS